jgi:hypothetical protein
MLSILCIGLLQPDINSATAKKFGEQVAEMAADRFNASRVHRRFGL